MLYFILVFKRNQIPSRSRGLCDSQATNQPAYHKGNISCFNNLVGSVSRVGSGYTVSHIYPVLQIEIGLFTTLSNKYETRELENQNLRLHLD